MRLKLIIDDERASRKVLYPAVTNIHPDISIADLSRRIESDFKFSVKSLSLDGFTLLSKSATTDVLRDGDTVEVHARKGAPPAPLANESQKITSQSLPLPAKDQSTESYDKGQSNVVPSSDDQQDVPSKKRRRKRRRGRSSSSSNVGLSKSGSLVEPETVTGKEKTIQLGTIVETDPSESLISNLLTEFELRKKELSSQTDNNKNVEPISSKAKKQRKPKSSPLQSSMSTSRPSIPTESASSTAKEKQIQPIQPPKKMPNFLRNKNKRKGFYHEIQNAQQYHQHIRFDGSDSEPEEIPSTKSAEQVIPNEVFPTPAPTAVSSPLANSLFISAVECSTRPATVREPRSQQHSLEESRNAEVDTHQANSLGADNAHEVTQQEKLPYHETYSEFDYASLTAEDFLQYPALDVQSLPSVPKNSVISYKVLELSNAFTPEISDYKVASVINMLPELKAFQLRLLHPLESAHAEPDEDEEMEDGNMSREKMKEKVRRSMLRGSIDVGENGEDNPEITVAWGDLIDARVLSWGMLGA